jgi:superfamily II DNA or RNA helicase
VELLQSHGIRIELVDERFAGKRLDVSFRGELRPDQERAVSALLPHDTGVLSAGTAFGKTVIATWMIAVRKTNTLILVHRRQLLDQWRECLSIFLDIPLKSIGQIGAGRRKPTHAVDVALLQSLNRKGVVDDSVAEYGHVIVDECHHLSAFSFEQVLRQVRARYVLGLTATPYRKDGHHPIILMQCGEIRHRVSAREQAFARPFRHLVLPRPTAFRLPLQGDRLPVHEIYRALTCDEPRNELIVRDVLSAVGRGRSPLVLTERIDHLNLLAARLERSVQNVIVLRGGMGARQRRAAMDKLARIPTNEERVIVAIGRYIGEGFDNARLDTLFLAMPISWKGTLQQYVGRLHRLHANKREVIVYDYTDNGMPMLAAMFRRRLKGYEAAGYSLVEEDACLTFLALTADAAGNVDAAQR